MRTTNLILLAVMASALAAPTAFAADAVITLPSAKTEIQLTQQATRSMPPDRLRATLRIEAKGNNGAQVQADINKRMAVALEKAKANQAIKVETGGYSVNRDFSVKESTQWQGLQTLTLSSGDFNAVLTLVGDLQNSGLLMSNMQFYLAPESLIAAQNQLTTDALTALRARTDAIAHDLDMNVYGFKSISIGNAQEACGSGRCGAPMMFAAAAKAAPAPAVEAGDSTITLSVNAAVLLSPKK